MCKVCWHMGSQVINGFLCYLKWELGFDLIHQDRVSEVETFRASNFLSLSVILWCPTLSTIAAWSPYK